MQDLVTCEPRLYPINDMVCVLNGSLRAKAQARSCPACLALCFAFWKRS